MRRCRVKVMSAKRFIKRLIGFSSLGRCSLKNTLSVFVYHEVSDRPSRFCEEFNLNVNPKLFDEHLHWIKDNFNVINPDELTNGDYKTPAAMITFDDGMPGYFKEAVPLMIKRNIPSIVFLNMAPVEGELFWSGLVTYLATHDVSFINFLHRRLSGEENIPDFLRCDVGTVNDYFSTVDADALKKNVRDFYGDFAGLKDLEHFSNHPLVFYGSHLYNHYNVLNLKDEELREQYFLNETRIKKYPNGRALFAYPFGQPGICFSPRHTELIRSWGARAVFSSGGNVNQVRRDNPESFYDRIGMDAGVQTINDLFGRIQWKRLKKLLRRK